MGCRPALTGRHALLRARGPRPTRLLFLFTGKEKEAKRKAPGCPRCHALPGAKINPRSLTKEKGASNCLESLVAGPKAAKSFGQAFSKACGFQRQSLWSLPAGSETSFRREHFSLAPFLFAIEKERGKPCAPHRGRAQNKGRLGLLVTNGGSRLELHWTRA